MSLENLRETAVSSQLWILAAEDKRQYCGQACGVRENSMKEQVNRVWEMVNGPRVSLMRKAES